MNFRKPQLKDQNITKPTFTQFVKFHLDGGTENDIHIHPMWHKCAFCIIPYDVIGKVETADDDNKYIILKVFLTLLLHLHKNYA